MKSILAFVKKYWMSIVYEIVTISSNLAIGSYLFGIPFGKAVSIFMTFFIASLLIGGKMHFRPWYQCMFWSCHLLIGCCYLYSEDIYLCYLLCILFAYLLSHKADLKDTDFRISQWKPRNQSKYQKELDYVKYNPISPDLIAFESRLESENDNFTFMCYRYIFKQGMSWDRAAEELQIESKRLCPVIDKIAFGIRLACHI